MDRAVHNYVLQACKSVEGATDVGTVLVILRTLKAVFLDGCLDNICGLAPPTVPALEHVHSLLSEQEEYEHGRQQQLQRGPPSLDSRPLASHAGLRREVFLRQSCGTFVNVLLAVVAPDWQAAMTRAQQAEAVLPFYDACPAPQLLGALSRHLDAVRPYSEAAAEAAGLSVADPTSQEADRQLRRRFLTRGAPGMRQLFSSMCSGHVSKRHLSAGAVSHEEVIYLLATLPDKCTASSGITIPSDVVVAVVGELLSAADSADEAKDADGGVSAGVETMQRMILRGYCQEAAAALLGPLLETDPLKGGAEARDAKHWWDVLLGSWTDSPALEKLVLQLLQDAGERGEAAAAAVARNVLSEKALQRRDLRYFLVGKLAEGRAAPLPSAVALRGLLLALAGLAAPEAGGQHISFLQELLLACAATWNAEEAIQRHRIPRQAFETLLLQVGISLLGKDGVESTAGLLPAIIKGVGGRLESPITAIRFQGMRVGRTLSEAVGGGSDAEPLFADMGDLGMLPEEEWETLCRGADRHSTPHGTELPRSECTIRGSSPGTPVAGGSNSRNTGSHDGNGRFPQPARETPPTRVSASLLADDKHRDEDDEDPDEIVSAASYRASFQQPSKPRPSTEEEDKEYDSDDSLEPYDMPDSATAAPSASTGGGEGEGGGPSPVQLSAAAAALRGAQKDVHKAITALNAVESLIAANPDELKVMAPELVRALLYTQLPDWALDDPQPDGRSGEALRRDALQALLVHAPQPAGAAMAADLYSPNLDVSQRLLILNSMADAARQLAAPPAREALAGAGDLSGSGGGGDGRVSAVGGVHGERTQLGKSRVWGTVRLRQLREEAEGRSRRSSWSNRFSDVALEWMEGILKGWHVPRHGVDLLGRDFLVLGHLLVTLGTFVQCSAPATSALQGSAALLELLKEPGLHAHGQPFVRRCALVAAAQVVEALPPARVAVALRRPDDLLAQNIQWLAGWVEQTAQSDTDSQCQALAAACSSRQAALTYSALSLAAAPKAEPEVRPAVVGLQDLIGSLRRARIDHLT